MTVSMHTYIRVRATDTITQGESHGTGTQHDPTPIPLPLLLETRMGAHFLLVDGWYVTPKLLLVVVVLIYCM